MTDFAKEIHRLTTVYNKRLRAVSKIAVQAVIKDMQTTQGAGGRMPVDTGWLRASLAANVGSMPYGNTGNPQKVTFTTDGSESTAAALLKWAPEKGEVFYTGYLANYAPYMETRYGFLRGAVEKWDRRVNDASIEVKAKIK